MPGASEIVFDRREADVKTLIQVSNGNEKAVQLFKENPTDVMDFDLIHLLPQVCGFHSSHYAYKVVVEFQVINYLL